MRSLYIQEYFFKIDHVQNIYLYLHVNVISRINEKLNFHILKELLHLQKMLGVVGGVIGLEGTLGLGIWGLYFKIFICKPRFMGFELVLNGLVRTFFSLLVVDLH